MNKRTESAATLPPGSRAAQTASATSLPNILTYARIAAVPALVACFFLLRGDDWANWLALANFVAAGLTDILDGYVAPGSSSRCSAACSTPSPTSSWSRPPC
jgi:hypothetical protein